MEVMNHETEILIPHGGLNGSLDMCISHLLNQTVMPAAITILVDSDNVQGASQWLIRHARERGVKLNIHYDTNTQSIIDMRFKLIDLSNKAFSVFVDDDMILHHRALENILAPVVMNIGVPFFEGHRIEIGGRKDAHFAATEMKLVSEANQKFGVPQSYGDTGFMLFQTLMFREIDRTKIMQFYNKRNIGGSDFALTSLVAQKHGPGMSVPGAFGWHTASEAKGYWKNYAAADSIFNNVFKKD